MYAEVVTTLSLLLTCVSAQAEQVRMTLLSINHFQSEANGQYQCHLSEPDTSYITVTSFRAVHTRNGGDNNKPPPDQEYQENNRYPHYKVTLDDNDNNDWFGVLGCKATRTGKTETKVLTTRMRSDADFVPANTLFTQTVNIGDEHVNITMDSRTERSTTAIRWRKNGGAPIRSSSATFSFATPIKLNDTGTYECHIQGERDSAKQGLNLLLVRACAANRWGPPNCIGVCNSCYNGGICDENNGKCVCPPGFMGDNCLQACGGNRYGHSCEIRCSSKKSEGSCSTYLFCLAHPFGCRCNTGWEGLACDSACGPNTFGASCLQLCHCISNECNPYTGICTGSDTRCKPGWTGHNCQECDDNYFGTDCNQRCRCSNENCNRESGLCKPGGCLPQWVDLYPPYSCQTGLKNATYTKVNPEMPVPVTCRAVEGPQGNLRSLQLVLSKDSENLEDEDITADDRSQDGTTGRFTATNVHQGNFLYCQLRNGTVNLAVLNISVDFFVLPVLTSSPVNNSVSTSSVTISWSAWDETRDDGDPPLVGYIPYYKITGKPAWMPSKILSNHTLMHTFTGLDPNTFYSFSVSAVRQGEGGDGPRSPEISVRTVCDVPSKPETVTAKISGENQENIEVSWQLPLEGISCSSGVIKFTIYYSWGTNLKKVDVRDTSATSFILYDLTPGVSYTLYVTLSTSGEESERSNEIIHTVPGGGGVSPVVIGVSTTLSVLLILLLTLSATLIVRRRQRKKPVNTYYETSGVTNKSYKENIHGPEPFPKSDERREEDDGYEAIDTNLENPVPIMIADFEKYMRDCDIRRSANLEHQFQLLNGNRQSASDVGQKEQNKTKNRFKNMIAYDHSRVVLEIINGDSHSDYYNANYIKNVQSEVAFIAAQGPNKASVGDFWRMVWKENVCNIVMLTNLMENGKDRCIQYWPPTVGAMKPFGEIFVKLISDEQLGDYNIRELQVGLGENVRRVTNWHFKTWPEKDIPDQPSPFIEYARRIKMCQKLAGPGHLLVHCSSGTGRTGTFIALYTLMDVIETYSTIDIYGYVEQMRQDRIKMVQSERQYKFLHECLLEIFLTGNTKIPVKNMKSFDIHAEKENLRKQFKVLAKLDKRSASAHAATPEEAEKSRHPKIIPVDKRRRFLQTPEETTYSNCINSCFVTSYKKKDAFIATQSPLFNTVEDFWRLVYDWKCPLIVMLNQLDPGDKICCKYWPENASSRFGNMCVMLKEKQNMGIYVHRQFELTDLYNEEPRLVYHMQLNSWDERNHQNLTILIRDMKKIHQEYSMVAPTVVHCINGVGRTGVFLTVNSEMDRWSKEGMFDVFQTVRQLRRSNRSMVYTQEDYYLCHQLLKLEFSDPFYANILKRYQGHKKGIEEI